MLESIVDQMTVYQASWWVAGGWAIDLHLGRQHRPHKDVDLAVLRGDQGMLQSSFREWSLHKVVNGTFESWRPNESLELPIHDVHVTRREERLEFLLNEAYGDTWSFRRNLNVSMPLMNLTRYSSENIPYLCPEIVLLYKAKSPSAFDDEDFERARSVLDTTAKQWLADALNVCHPGHPWICDLG